MAATVRDYESRGGASYEMINKIFEAVTLRDVLMIIGLALIGTGLYLFIPWVSFTVCGVIVFAGGFFSRGE
jgi:hypothetical protein